jgi:hypothetical protein
VVLAGKNDELIIIYKIFRSYEEHENALINHRTSWLVTVQSVLLATFGFSFQKHLEIVQKIADMAPLARDTLSGSLYQFKIFLAALPVIGIVTCFGSYMSIRAARDAQSELRKQYNSEYRGAISDSLKLPPIAGGSSKSAEDHGSSFAYFLPVFFFLLWAIVLFGVLLAVRVQIA